MSEILKPCPFCEGEAKEFKDTLVYTSVPNGAQYIVWCTKCGCRSPMNIENKEEAIKAWNKRPNPWHTGTPTEDVDTIRTNRSEVNAARYNI